MNLSKFNSNLDDAYAWQKDHLSVYENTTPPLKHAKWDTQSNVVSPAAAFVDRTIDDFISPNCFLSSVLERKDAIPNLEGINTFVETGTFCGLTTMAFANVFDNVHTVDIQQWDAYANIKKKCDNINFWIGESVEFLENVIPTIADERCLFLLDAHDDTHIVPLLDELECIRSLSNVNDHVIIIDDCRDAGHGAFPSMEAMINKLHQINPNYVFHDTEIITRAHIAYEPR